MLKCARFEAFMTDPFKMPSGMVELKASVLEMYSSPAHWLVAQL
jgi:hypothetical protein